jgi:Raf kinase inhibitor-like YbhB/YbcL family protein
MMRTQTRISAWRTRASLALGIWALGLNVTVLADDAGQWDQKKKMELTSTTFADGEVLPISMIYESANPDGTNACSVDGSTGGNTSPELAWTNAPRDTRSFAVVLYDTTAAFTHWGIYNISPERRSLPANAGAPTSKFGRQIENDFFLGTNGYDGPCPPAVQPFVHHYVFTVYALDTSLELKGSTNFPASAETLYHALIRAGQEGHILASASIAGLYSVVAPAD